MAQAPILGKGAGAAYRHIRTFTLVWAMAKQSSGMTTGDVSADNTIEWPMLGDHRDTSSVITAQSETQ
eukprot:11099310-Alexandrium_andersonii.AAC.1